MDIVEVQKKIRDLEKDFSKKLKTFTEETDCVVEDLYISDASFEALGKKEATLICYSIKIRTYL